MESAITNVLQAAIDAGRVPGITAAVGNRAGLLYEGGFGERSLGGGIAMSPDTLCWIASMTKAVTGAAAMQLVEQGKLSLDTPAGDVCEYLARIQVLDGFDDEGQPLLRTPKRPVTLRHLLTHSAGFAYEIWNGAYGKYMEATGQPSIFSGVNAGLEMPLVFDPGDDWEYGISIDWVGKMVEAASGLDLETYMQRSIFEPLQMPSTGFVLNDEKRSRMSEVHLRTAEGLGHLGFEMAQGAEFYMGGGGLYSTSADYLRFTRAILRGGELDGERILNTDTVADMSRNNMGECSVHTLTSIHPFSNDANFWPDMVQKWGLSFLINTEKTPEGRTAGSLAWAGLANSYYWIDPVRDITGVISMQLFPFADVEAMAIFREFESAVYASL
jgi:methyl acetate hydrolase